MGILEAKVVGADPGLVADRPARQRRLAGKQPVEARIPERKVAGAAVDGQVEAAAEWRDAAVGMQVECPRERPIGEPGEDREVGDPDRAAAGVDEVLELPGAEDRKAVATELELAQGNRTAGRQCRVREEIDAGPERLGHLGLRRPDTGREALDVDRDVAPGRIIKVLREATEPERYVLHLDVRRLEPVEHDEPVPAAGIPVVDVQHGRLEARTAAGNRQKHWFRSRGIAEAAGQREVAQEAVGGGLEAAVDVERGAGDVHVVDAQAAAGLAHAADPHRAAAGEEVAIRRRDQRCELAGKVDVEAEAFVARAQGDDAVGNALLRGIERERDIDLIERAGAFDAQVDRRGSLDPQQGRDDAALRLVEVEVKVELPRRVRERRLQREVAAGRIAALDVEPGVERAPREVQRPVERELRRLAEDALIEADRGDLQLGDLDRDRQLGQGEGLGLDLGQRVRRPRRYLGPPQPGDALGAQPVHRDAAAQQREPAPVELDVVDLEPGALRVGDGDALDPRP